MRLATWISYFETSDFPKQFPYTARSPTLRKGITYESIEDVNDEVDRILQEPDTKKFGVGQSLYYQTSIICSPASLIPDWCWEMLEDYNACKKFNIPLAKNLDEASVWMLDCFNIIESEISNCTKHQKEKDGKG